MPKLFASGEYDLRIWSFFFFVGRDEGKGADRKFAVFIVANISTVKGSPWSRHRLRRDIINNLLGIERYDIERRDDGGIRVQSGRTL